MVNIIDLNISSGNKNYTKWHCGFEKRPNRCSKNKYTITKIKAVMKTFRSNLDTKEKRFMYRQIKRKNYASKEQENEKSG